MNEKVRTSQITKSKFVISYLRRSILPNLPWRKNEVTLLNSCDAKRFCDVSFILIFWIRGWVIFKNYFQDYSRLFFHFLAMTTAASQYSAAKRGRSIENSSMGRRDWVDWNYVGWNLGWNRLKIPPGAAFGGAPGALRAPGRSHFRQISTEHE